MYHPEGPSLLELARQCLSSTEAGYDLLAPKFEHTPFCVPPSVAERFAAEVFRAGPVPAALDVCCGTGALTRQLRPYVTERLVGVDFSQGMLDLAAASLAPSEGQCPVELLRMDARALAFRESFDVVTCVGAFGHFLPHEEDLLVEGIRHALRPGGRFVFLTGPRPSARESAWWKLRAFNAAMRVRNAVWSPPFVMYYLTFLWPDVQDLLSRHGLHAAGRTGVFPAPFDRWVLVEATRG